MKTTISLVALAATLVGAGLPAEAGEPGDAFRGNAYAQGMCGSCHSITADASPSPNLAATPFQKVTLTFASGDEFAAWFNSKHPPTANSLITSNQASDIASYIASLKSGSAPK